MQSRINSKLHAIWKRMLNKEYRDAFVAADNSNTIAAQIFSMRNSRKWTQKDLADRCGMRQPRISALEDPDFENVEIATLQRIASAFDVAILVSFVPFSDIARRTSNHENSDFSVVDFANDNIEFKIKTVKNIKMDITHANSGVPGYHPISFNNAQAFSRGASKLEFSSLGTLH